MTVLVIGGEGYIGTHLIQHLQKSNVDVVSYGNRLNDYDKLPADWLSRFSDIVLLAGHSSVQMCVGNIRHPWRNNVRNFINLVNKTSPSTRILYASSSSVYGSNDIKMYTEEDLCLDVINNYDITKVTLDLAAQKFIKEGRHILGMRFGTVNGGSPVIRKDLMINLMVHTALTEKKIVITNKSIKRPVLALNDLSRAVECILKAPVFIPGMFNLASFNSTVEQFAWGVEELTGVSIHDAGVTEGVYNFSIDTSKFKSLYNFTFDETITTTIQDVIDCYELRKPKVVIRNEIFNYD